MTMVLRTLAIASVVVLGSLLPQTAVAAPKDKQPLYEFATGDAVPGAYSKLDRSLDAIATQIRTSAMPGHAATIWYVLFNNPAACSDGSCGEDDIFLNGDPEQGFDFAQIDAARVSVVYGGDGAIVNPGGRLALNGGLAEGQIPSGENQVVIGHPDDGALVPGPVTGLEDAQLAEIHTVLQDHGTAHDDPELRASQLSGFNTACNPECVDVQFAIHLP